MNHKTSFSLILSGESIRIAIRRIFLLTGGIGKHNCRHTEDAGVKCAGPDMSRKCVNSCIPGSFKGQGNICEQCSLKCKTCKGKADKCSSCLSPYFFAESKMDCVTKCPRGFYGNIKDRLCTPCDKVCLTCANGESGNRCESCPSGLFLSKLALNYRPL